MESRLRALILLNAFKNRTKLQIITLLLKNGPMTVTQISRFVKTTRSNLYQTIKDLTDDGVVVLKKSKVTKNYVEKFYGINLDLFESVSNTEIEEAITKLGAQDLKDLIISYLLASSFILRVLSEEVSFLNENEIEHYRKLIISGKIIMSFSTFPESLAEPFFKVFSDYMKSIESKGKGEKDKYFLSVSMFPLFSVNAEKL